MTLKVGYIRVVGGPSANLCVQILGPGLGSVALNLGYRGRSGKRGNRATSRRKMRFYSRSKARGSAWAKSM